MNSFQYLGDEIKGISLSLFTYKFEIYPRKTLKMNFGKGVNRVLTFTWKRIDNDRKKHSSCVDIFV